MTFAARGLTLLCTLGIASAQVRDALPVPDVGAYRTLKCDFHMHTVFSDGEVWPLVRVREAWRDGLDAIAITDHSVFQLHHADLSTDLNRPFVMTRTLAAQLGIIVIPGVEISDRPTPHVHANALFVKDPNVFKGLDLTTALRRAREQDAFVFWNHPSWARTAESLAPVVAAHNEKQVQGVELVNGLKFHKDAYPWVSEKNFAILANSDAHHPVSDAPRQRPITLVFASSRDSAGIREALFARRSAAWMGGEIWGPETLLKGLWEGAIELLTTELSASGAIRAPSLILRNRSAIAFKLRVSKAPAWLGIREAEIREEKITAMPAQIAKNAPVGRSSVQVEFEVANLHTRPGRNLTVTLPVTVEVK